MATLTDIIDAMTALFTFFTSLFSSLFSTVTGTPIMWVPIAISLLMGLVFAVPKLVRRLRRV